MSIKLKELYLLSTRRLKNLLIIDKIDSSNVSLIIVYSSLVVVLFLNYLVVLVEIFNLIAFNTCLVLWLKSPRRLLYYIASLDIIILLVLLVVFIRAIYLYNLLYI